MPYVIEVIRSGTLVYNGCRVCRYVSKKAALEHNKWLYRSKDAYRIVPRSESEVRNYEREEMGETGGPRIVWWSQDGFERFRLSR